MELFTLFLFFCFFAGVALRNRKAAERTWLLLVVGLGMCLLYYVLQRLI
jgi:hypothetical protein